MRAAPTRIATVILAGLVFLLPASAGALDWTDDFDDRDFTNDPTWTEINMDDVPGLVEVTGSDNYVRFFRDAPLGNGGNVLLVHVLELGIADETTIQFDVNPVFSNFPQWNPYSSAHPIEVLLHLRDAGGADLQLEVCYDYRGGSSLTQPTFIRVAFPYCEQGVWLRNEQFVIRDYFPQAEVITSITLAARGWDFEGYVDNVYILDAVDVSPVDNTSWGAIKALYM